MLRSVRFGAPLRHRRRGGWIWLISLLLAVAFAAYAYLTQSQLASEEVRLVRVSDGDTLVVKDADGHQIKVRLIGVDAPELGTAASFRSALFAAELCERASTISVEPEPTHRADKYGRTLGWVWLTMPDGKRLLLNEEMIKRGQARLYRDTGRNTKYYNRLH